VITLSKTLTSNNNDFVIIEIDKSRENIIPSGSNNVFTHPFLGFSSGNISIPPPPNVVGENFVLDVPSGLYSVVFLSSFNISRNTLISADITVNYYNVTTSNNTTINVKPFIQNNSNYTYVDYENADKTTNVILDNISFQNTTTYDLSDVLVPLNNSVLWNQNSRVAVLLDAISISGGLKTVAPNSLTIVYKASKPTIPSNPTGSGQDSSAYLSWNPPIDNGGDDIIDYSIRYYNIDTNTLSTINTLSSGTNFVLNNLNNNNSYAFTVAAINRVGTGNYSLESNIFIPKETINLASLTYNDANYTRIRLRRDSSVNWHDVNPVLALGEAGFETDTKFLKVGNNLSPWSELDYVKVPNSSISFPSPPSIFLPIGDSASNTRVICNLSNNERLNIIGLEGIDIDYLSNSNSITWKLNKLFSPFVSGTLASPNSIGRPGEVLYDDLYMYICVGTNFWKKILIDNSFWFVPDIMSISNISGLYPSTTSIFTSGNTITYLSDGDPYPAKASAFMTNDGVSPRAFFMDSREITDQTYYFTFPYRAGSAFGVPELAISGYNGILNNGALISGPATNNENLGIFPAPNGFNYNRQFFDNFFKIDDCGGYVNSSGIYSYYNGKFLNNCWNDSKVYNNSYYLQSNYSGNYFRHSDGHSKILGFAFDGYPIYGPFGYSNPSGSGDGIVFLTSSYVSYTNDDHRPLNWKYTNSISVNNFNYILGPGAFVQDFYYAHGSGLLDEHNGRYAVTPEFPKGTYSYHLTFSTIELLIPTYPYIIGNNSYNQKIKVFHNV
jgi:hypothetical protein